MQENFDPSTITTLHKTSIIRWKANGIEYQHKQFLQLVEENHAFNFQLWHAEDKARRDDMALNLFTRPKEK